MQKPITTTLDHIIPILSEEHQQLIDNIVQQIESNHVTYILPKQSLNAVQIAETTSRTIELAKSGQTYVAKPHLIESFDDFDAKLVEHLKHSFLLMNLQVPPQKLSFPVQKTN